METSANSPSHEAVKARPIEVGNQQPRLTPDARLGLVTFLLIPCLTFLAIYQLQPPAPVPAHAPPAEFSSGRALEHLKVIAQRPHPTGSEENARVREYIVKQLTAMGLEPRVQTTTVVRPNLRRGAPAVAATVSNIVARLKGTANTKAVMLAAHYDSVSSGPGASDDGSGTVTLLETARALKADAPLRNDVILLITDGEELGLLGAKAFVDEHPWVKDVGVVLNFEARGACGPSLMFETSPGNRALIREFAKVAPHPVTSSVMYEFYKRLPNRTDFTVFKQAGLAGLNFAYIGCWPRYHTMTDSVENLNERSLQHDGAYAVALARNFGNLSLPRTAQGSAVYFSLFGRTLFYSQAWGMPLAVIAMLLLATVLAVGLRRTRLTWRGLGLGFVAWFACAAVAAAVSKIAWELLVKTRVVSSLPYGMAYSGELCAIGFVVLAVAISSGLYVRFRRHTAVENLTAGALLVWGILTLLASLYVPTASYLFVWPLLASLIALGLTFGGDSQSLKVRLLGLLLPAISGILLLAPLICLFITALGTAALAMLTVSATLLLGVLVPHLNVMTAQNRWLLPGGAAIAGLGIIAIAIFTNRFDAKHPRADSTIYVLNADTRKAVWATADKALDAWTSQFFAAGAQKGTLADYGPFEGVFFKSAAPTAPLAAPTVATVDDITIGDTRTLRLWINSPRHARVASIFVQEAKLLEASVNGKPVIGGSAAGRGSWELVYVGLRKTGAVLSLSVKGSQPLTITIVDTSDGLPELPGVSFKSRPEYLALRLDSSTLVSNTFRFEARP